ncbi:hypothetical protein JW890_06865 [candidate division WOR-3 bacterium]|nr:hypothetical protein [candidate division WOR-3 bacterium]
MSVGCSGEFSGETAIEASIVVKDKAVKNNMQKLKEAVDLYIIESPNSVCPLSLSEITLPSASNPFSSTMPAYVDGMPSSKGQVGYVSDGKSYQIHGYGSEGILEYVIKYENQ